MLGNGPLASGDIDNRMFLAIAGNIGSGKSTLTQKLSARLGWRPMFESVEGNPYLDDFYSNMLQFSFPLQIYFLNHRFSTHKFIQESNASCIQDRSIYEDAHIFARGLHEGALMSDRDYENYLTLYKTMIEFLEPPTLMVYLKRSVPKLVERIRQRNRECEKSISVDYITQLNQYYDEWIDSYNSGKCLIINTDELDFLNNEAHFHKLVDKINQSIDQQELQITFH